MADILLTKFTQTVFGYWISGAVFGLVDSGLSERIGEEPTTAEKLAEEIGADPDMVDSICRAACAVGVLAEVEAGYSWTPVGARFLAPDAPEPLGHWVRIMSRWQEAWRDMGQAVRDSAGARREAGHRLSDDPAYERDLSLGFFEYASLGSDAVAEAIGLDAGLLVDVGSGPGAYSIAACRRSTKVHAALLDRPVPLEVAAEVLDREGFAGRISLHPGDYLVDEFPSGAGAVLMSNMLHIEPPENRMLLLEKAKASLVDGGRLVVHGHFMGPGAGGMFAALQGLSSSVLWNVGGGITVPDTIAEMTAVGFRCEEPRQMGSPGAFVLIGHAS